MSSSGSRPVRYLALIYLKPGQQDRLRQYENRVLPVFRRHGGAFERIWSPVPAEGSGAPDPEAPDEIHLLRFETEAGLEAVRRDPEMQALVPLRLELVRKALPLRIEDVPLGAYFSSGA
jgi:uncharacterized protein (DUF1330 family)